MDGIAKPDLSEENLNQLIELVYQTLEDDSAWQPFFKRCCDSVGAKMIHMFAHDKTIGAISYSNGINMPVAGELAVLQKYIHLDPTLAYYDQMKLFEWLNDHEVLSQEVIESSPFYYEFLSTYDTKYRHFAHLIDNKQVLITFGLLTSPSQGPLPPECLRFLDKLLPHISRVCRLSIHNFIYSTQALVGHALVSKLRQPVILASVSGEIVHINDAGHELLTATDLISIEEGYLQIPPEYSQHFYDDCAAMEYTLKANLARLSYCRCKSPIKKKAYTSFTACCSPNARWALMVCAH